MRTSITALNVPHFNSRRAAKALTLSVLGAALLSCVIAPTKAHAQSPIITATEYQDPTNESVDNATSYLDISFTDPNNGFADKSNYLFQYNWDSNAAVAPTGYDLLTAFTNDGLTESFTQYSFGAAVDQITYQAPGSTSVSISNGVAGGWDPNNPDAFWDYFQSSSLQQAEAGTETYSNYGVSSTTLAPGSVDGYIYDYGQADPVVPSGTVTPAPESSTLIGMGIGLSVLMSLACFRFRGQNKKGLAS